MSQKRTLLPTSNRRSFLRGSAAALGGAALTGPLSFLHTKALANGTDLCGTRGPSPYGDLRPAKDRITGLELIMLPRGFRYYTMSWYGDLMSDGNLVPEDHDGMALVGAANPGGRARGASQAFTLIRNHEVNSGTPIAPTNNYDELAGGGTTVVRWKKGKVIEDYVNASGTANNCAGGPSPWNTWLTCEETLNTYNEPHGYVFETLVERPTSAPVPLVDMGRFSHEAVAFDYNTGDVYLTEDESENTPGEIRDRGNSGFYRFIPNNPLGGPGSLEAGGDLYMLQALDPTSGAPVDDLRNPECWAEYDVNWVPISDPNAPPVQIGPTSGDLVSGPYVEGRNGGASRFQRLEGAWWDATKGLIIFVDTEAGPIGVQPNRDNRAEGAVWAYDPATSKLKCIFVSQGQLAPGGYPADNPDNVTVSPNGGILLCEDGGTDDGNGLSLMGLMPNGQTFEFARNIINITSGDADALNAAGHNPGLIGVDDYSDQEWAGATFSPDGKWLFVNIQTPGITFAITGPFARGIF